MIATKQIKKGEEIFNDYGPLPRSDLVRRYGYVSDEYKQWDVIEISSQNITEAIMKSKGENRNAGEYAVVLTEKEIDERVSICSNMDDMSSNDVKDQAGRTMGFVGGIIRRLP